MRRELSYIVGKLYCKYGLTEEVIELNKLLDILVLDEQKEIIDKDIAFTDIKEKYEKVI